MWTREVLDVIEQCVSLPGETSQIVWHYLRQQCISRGCRCQTLYQLQLPVRIGGRGTSVLELFLLRLDERGIDISSPWGISGGDSIVGTLWLKLYAIWLSKEQWADCREVVEEVRSAWEQAQLCLTACAGLGSAEPAILSKSQFRGTQTQWLRLDELACRHCHLTPFEHATITSWLSMTESQQLEAFAETSGATEALATDEGRGLPDVLYRGSHVAAGNTGMNFDPVGLEQAIPTKNCLETVGRGHLRCPPYIRGQIIGAKPHNQLVLQCTHCRMDYLR